MATTTLRRLLTADEYQRMAETGILDEDERIELLDGEMYVHTPTGVHQRHLSADEYQQMADVGILDEDEQIELIGGEMYHMAAIGVRHADTMRALNRLLNHQVGPGALVDVQDPVRLDDETLPQPDITIVRDRRYRDGHPTPRDILMVFEVADSSRAYDRGPKFPRYAAAGIAEAWLVDLTGNLIERHSDPRDGMYRQVITARPGDTLASTVLTELAIPVDAVLGSTETP
jgi:Uma2 family endonuclease